VFRGEVLPVHEPNTLLNLQYTPKQEMSSALLASRKRPSSVLSMLSDPTGGAQAPKKHKFNPPKITEVAEKRRQTSFATSDTAVSDHSMLKVHAEEDSESSAESTSSSGSSSEDESDDDDDDDGMSVNGDGQDGEEGEDSADESAAAPMDLRARLSSFLPALAKANSQLELERQAGTLRRRDIENLDDSDDDGESDGNGGGSEEDEGKGKATRAYIEMNLGLGVLEEKRPGEESGESSGSGSDEEGDDLLAKLLNIDRAKATHEGGMKRGMEKPAIEVVDDE
jgi:hypothetical protein